MNQPSQFPQVPTGPTRTLDQQYIETHQWPNMLSMNTYFKKAYTYLNHT